MLVLPHVDHRRKDIGIPLRVPKTCRRMGVMGPADYPFSWVMPESISGREVEFERTLYVRDINNWIKAGRACTSGSLTAPTASDSTLNASRRAPVSSSFSCSSLPAFLLSAVLLITFLLPNSIS